MQSEYCPGVLFEQDSQSQKSGKELCGFLSEKRGDQFRQKFPCQIPRQEYSSERIREHVEMDAQISYRLQVEEQVKGQWQSFKQLIESKKTL